ncbi:unnamed protein product (macronuclear) [Paramecium tetraurelia]|uniref:Uncharacterized protein n=1 Tax=Paramecium tetraurelia TaxID=5888 RepID=A0BM00_PARTE|nr:uncharacterized protein GSPATT00030201001 [Paramecium tetraurelia]CAK59567.1 unnamed protein product [Paramecium tetraurelia]|eukprot:XP_001426965.1 hypothetical protein (macronuclear) [Paramecium tetraurelia strain d4-2]
MQNKSFKDILGLQVVKVQLVQKPTKENKDEPIHYGVIVTTTEKQEKQEKQEKYLLHNGYKFGKIQDFILTSAHNLSNNWEITQNYELETPIKLNILFQAGCCGQNMRYHSQMNNSKHAQDRIVKMVNDLINSKQNIG